MVRLILAFQAPYLSCIVYVVVSKRGFAIPQITINTGISAPDGHEEMLTEYFCDHPGCPNVATHLLGYVKEIALAAAVCDEHAPSKFSFRHTSRPAAVSR